jgi:hypothetical protein
MSEKGITRKFYELNKRVKENKRHGSMLRAAIL